MRTVYGLLVVSLLLFVGSIWFILAGARNAGRAPASPPVASVKQLMNGLVTPASNAIYNAVSTTVTAAGVDEVRPRNDREWEIVGANAVMLVEASALLEVEGRARDTGQWMSIADSMAKAASTCKAAADTKDVDALLACGETLNNTCDSCHREYAVVVP